MELQRRHSSKIVPGPMSEHTLQVWRALPLEIRHDPTMVSFQMENERIHGTAMFPEKESTFTEESNITEENEYITMRKPAENTNNDCELAQQTEKLQTFTAAVNHESKEHKTRNKIYKRVGLLAFWLFCVLVLMTIDEKRLVQKTVVVPNNKTKREQILPT